MYHKDKPNFILWQSVHREWSASQSSKSRRHFAGALQTPQSADHIKRFVGMVTFLSNHLPNFSEHTAVLRDLTKKDAVFLWDETHQRAFEHLKELVASSVSLVYYNPNDETTLEVDSTMRGMGAALIQTRHQSHSRVRLSPRRSRTIAIWRARA